MWMRGKQQQGEQGYEVEHNLLGQQRYGHPWFEQGQVLSAVQKNVHGIDAMTLSDLTSKEASKRMLTGIVRLKKSRKLVVEYQVSKLRNRNELFSCFLVHAWQLPTAFVDT